MSGSLEESIGRDAAVRLAKVEVAMHREAHRKVVLAFIGADVGLDEAEAVTAARRWSAARVGLDEHTLLPLLEQAVVARMEDDKDLRAVWNWLAMLFPPGTWKAEHDAWMNSLGPTPPTVQEYEPSDPEEIESMERPSAPLRLVPPRPEFRERTMREIAEEKRELHGDVVSDGYERDSLANRKF